MGFGWVICFLILFSKWGVDGFAGNGTDESFLESEYSGFAAAVTPGTLMVDLTLIQGAAVKGAVCMDGSLPGYHLHLGFGSGANKWIVNLEGGGWCNNIMTCDYRKTSRLGSSLYYEKQIPFTGILSNKNWENPDFFNWNRAKIRYCDGASFASDSENMAHGLQFRGQLIWQVAIEELMSKGLRNASHTLLSGCSAGGLATILHCDEFHNLFPRSTIVKCLSDAGLFMDVKDVSGGSTMRNLFSGVVGFLGVGKNLPKTCHLNSTSCFFPQNLINYIKTPLFILNSAYDAWQVSQSLTLPPADPHKDWSSCRMSIDKCSPSQIQFLQGFRNQMLSAVKGFAAKKQSGVFINSCFAHCQSEKPDTWFTRGGPVLGKKAIATSVGDWYFDRAKINETDCPYPCDKTCHNMVNVH